MRIGSLGKTVWGGLRVGWIRAEGDLMRRLVAARSAHDLGTPEFEQAVAAGCCCTTSTRSSRSARMLLREGRDALVAALAEHLPEWGVPQVHGGVSLWIELDAALSPALVMDVRSRGLLLSAGPRFSVDGGHERHLRIPFTAPAEELERAVVHARGVVAARARGRAGLVQSSSSTPSSEPSPREPQAVDRIVGRPELAEFAERPRRGVESSRAVAHALRRRRCACRWPMTRPLAIDDSPQRGRRRR